MRSATAPTSVADKKEARPRTREPMPLRDTGATAIVALHPIRCLAFASLQRHSHAGSLRRAAPQLSRRHTLKVRRYRRKMAESHSAMRKATQPEHRRSWLSWQQSRWSAARTTWRLLTERSASIGTKHPLLNHAPKVTKRLFRTTSLQMEKRCGR